MNTIESEDLASSITDLEENTLPGPAQIDTRLPTAVTSEEAAINWAKYLQPSHQSPAPSARQPQPYL